ncbi:MAG: hypothetical protein WBL28_04280 [Methylotenera sp.]
MKNLFKLVLLGAFMITLNACATGGGGISAGDEEIDHAFELDKGEFDKKAGVERVQILDFLYGNPTGYAIKNPPEYKARGECMQGISHGNLGITRKDLKIFYVKWLDKTTGKVHEVTLDLQKKLPKDFSRNHRFFASFKQGQLYVYVITPEKRAANEPPQGPRAYDDLKMLLLYPEN